ncbi:MAG: DUF4867 family protein [Thomasclavelia sp.]|nr:DUF4867 family protein [Thomasclavelia sp.]
MSNFDEIRKLNPQYEIKSINDTSFKEYGILVDKDCSEGIDFATNYQLSSGYDSSIIELEQLPSIRNISNTVYGYLDVQVGIVSGHNNVLNGLEYHQCSETIIAVTDYILVVGHRWDINNNEYDSTKCVAFYIPQGSIVEWYATTLHYTPIAINKNGFKTICFLLKETGNDCQRIGILKKKNKWFIAHKDNIDKIKIGDFPGLKGKMIEINQII